MLAPDPGVPEGVDHAKCRPCLWLSCLKPSWIESLWASIGEIYRAVHALVDVGLATVLA
jgi:hypothetical protein